MHYPDTHHSRLHLRDGMKVQLLMTTIDALNNLIALRRVVDDGQPCEVSLQVLAVVTITPLPACPHHKLGALGFLGEMQRPVVDDVRIVFGGYDHTSINIEAHLCASTSYHHHHYHHANK